MRPQTSQTSQTRCYSFRYCLPARSGAFLYPPILTLFRKMKEYHPGLAEERSTTKNGVPVGVPPVDVEITAHIVQVIREGRIPRGNVMSTLMYLAFLLIFPLAFLLHPADSYAKSVTVIKEYTYQASEVDSKVSSRMLALEMVKRNLLEELGTYLISETVVKDFHIVKDQVKSYTAGIVTAQVLEERWDGKYYYLKAKIDADMDELAKEIERVHRNEEQSIQLEAMRKRTEGALKEIEDLKKETGKGTGDKVTQEKYTQAVDVLTAMDWFSKGWALRYKDYNLKDAMKAWDKTIELDPNFSMAYAGRASIYCEWQMYKEALPDSEESVKLDPSKAYNLIVRGRSYIGLRKFNEGFEDLNRAMELSPRNAKPYVLRSFAYYLMGKYDESMTNADKAIEIDPNDEFGYFQKGRVLVVLNEFQDAIKYLDKAIEYNPKIARFYFWRGKALLGNNEIEQAQEDMKKAARMGNKGANRYIKQKGI